MYVAAALVSGISGKIDGKRRQAYADHIYKK
jgi:hypothetical protein